MTTATCTTTECAQHGIAYNILGDPPRVECGGCGADCDLTDLRDDPPTLEEPTE